MQSRHIVITIGAAVAAFAVAFGLGKATSGSEAATGTAEAAQTFDLPSAEISAGAPKAGLPALKPKPKPKPKPTPEASAPSTVTPEPTAAPPSNTAPPSNSTPPSNSAPPAEEPVHGGGEG
jgi:hypothetical protein